MKYWQTHLLPVVLLATLAGLSFWLRETVERDSMLVTKNARHVPDAIADNMLVRRYDQTGHLRYEMRSPRAVHYGDDDSTEARSPVLTSYHDKAPPTTIRADHADITSKAEIVYLKDNVRIVRPATPQRAEMVARMPDLTVRPEEGLADTQSAVQLTQGNSWITGIGMHADNNLSTINLHSKVRGEYIRPATQP